MQLGLRGSVLRGFGGQELISIEDITTFVAEQRLHIADDFADLKTPKEEVYRPTDQLAAVSVGIEDCRIN